MKYQIVLLSLIVSLSGCVHRASNENIQEERPGTAVTTHAAFGKIEKKIILSATTSYQNKSMVSTPIPAFITEVLVQPGSRVKAGDILYRIESKEQHALGNSNTVIPIKAERDGIVLDVQQQAGSYVTESNVLCSFAEVGSLVFEINVPYEQKRYARSGSRCTMELPDGTRLTATVYAPLATMNTASQSERVIARAKVPFLPEGMNVKAVFSENGSSSDKGMILPKSAVQSDETLTQHWVMKLADNGTAVRVPIEVGNSNASEIEIKSDVLSPQDRIILTGGYGLEDGAKVVVTTEESAL